MTVQRHALRRGGRNDGFQGRVTWYIVGIGGRRSVENFGNSRQDQCTFFETFGQTAFPWLIIGCGGGSTFLTLGSYQFVEQQRTLFETFGQTTLSGLACGGCCGVSCAGGCGCGGKIVLRKSFNIHCR